MKKTIYTILIGICSLSVLCSCNSFLDIKPVGKVIPTSLNEYRALFTSVYDRAISDKSMCDMRTGDIQVRDDKYDQNNYADIEKWNNELHGSNFEWQLYYNSLYLCNFVIKEKNNIKDGAEAEINQLVGEAYLMRAYTHFTLVNIYGRPYTYNGKVDQDAVNSKAVPLKIDTDLEAVLSKNTVGDIYSQVLSDIKAAEELLNQKEWEIGLNYRFNTTSALALDSRVNLYMGNWQEAYDAAEKALAQKADLVDFSKAAEQGEEFILPNNYKSTEMICAYERIYNTTSARASKATESLFSLFDSLDFRLVNYFGDKNDSGTYDIKKTDGSSGFQCSFRTAELYLNSAEAATRLGKTAEARKRLLQLDETRYKAEKFADKKAKINTLEGEALLKEILTERRKELSCEGHAWFDLRRTTRPEIKKELKSDDDNTKTYVLKQNDPRYTIQIPKAAIDANPKLAE